MFFQRVQQRVQIPLLLSALLSVSATSSWAQKTVTFPVVDFPPYIMIDDSDKHVSGMDIRIVRAAFAEVGIDTDFEARTWPAIMEHLKQGKSLGTVSCARRPERAPFLLFSDELSTTSRAVISRTDANTQGIQSVSDLKNHKVIAIDGWDMERQLSEYGVQHKQVDSLTAGLKAIVEGSSDLFYVSDYPAMFQARNLGIHKKLKVTNMVTEPLVPLHVCFSKSYPESRELLQEFNKGLQIIKRNGMYQAIRNQYL